MDSYMKPLTSAIHLHTAMIDRLPIIVFIGNELVGAGRIAEVTENSVKIGDQRYIPEVCTFKYAS
ncbi:MULTISPECIES: hypothetical protein [Paenibacillus]|uniref:Uncharacterized protein n=1 Tax=Paenibacillus albilobatus TaxID=2716884 RepID=A0A919XEL7_9BACL|nr:MULTISPECIES: hypothetical protein [Paenibacillus]GIO30766.1 hypothetical protein J2TS6_19070 [Paenibacillus albilobatus]